MSKFFCRNSECDKFGVEEEYLSNSYRYVAGVGLQSNNAPCPSCGKIREEVDKNRDIPLSEKNIDVARYSSASPQQRKEILKKRSHDHYEKHVKPEKEHRLHETIRSFREASKK